MLPFSFSSFDPTASSEPPQGMEDHTNPSSADHLCVFVHGLWGNPNHLAYLSSALRDKYAQDKIHILAVKRNAGSFTYDGIELGGERVTQEIEDKLEELARNGTTIKKLSVVGYSLGGLVARYAIGLLYHKGWFDKLEPVNFTTFASPHLGVRTPLLGLHNHIWNVVGARTLSTSGRQLFTIDRFRDTGRPLLSVIADPDSIFIKALTKFRNRSLYANIINDRSTAYYTSGISRTDPFVNLDKVKVNYLKGFEPVIIDHSSPVTRKDDEALPALHKRVAGATVTVLSKLPSAVFFLVFIPIGTVLFLMNSAIQSVRSRQRIRLHHSGKAGIPVEEYRIPLISEMVQDVRQTAENFYGNVNQSQSQEYLPTGSEEETSPSSPATKKHKSRRSVTSAGEEKPLLSIEEEELDETDVDDEVPAQKTGDLDFPTLALTPIQFAMIQSLDNVGFRKYPVWIHNARHSHAAIIRRMNKKSFDEGKVVAKHWLGEFEI
ncbi:hypothetical protein EG328_000615 [Venturia inaequalis]|uniref:DUF676 domain-containing protein n=1 Tax=Venturia inaequalis TaxID=5025 RepID=A0A8H3Z261_VENIN|nr:hypothetical protein EG328_000615 [Venturia inaequalis]KAE9980453.1 hypothetical protein EG327_006555 [Venturia inaequalis]